MIQALVVVGALAIIAVIFTSSEYRSGWGQALRRPALLAYPVAAGVWPIVATIGGYALKNAGLPLRSEELFALQFVPLLVVSVVIAVTVVVRGFRLVVIPALALIVILLAEAAGTLFLGQSWGHVLAATIALLPALFVSREPGQLDILRRGLVLTLATLVLVLALFAIADPALAIRPCSQSLKCLLGDHALTVDYRAGSNVTGVTLALIAPAVIFTLRGWRAAVLALPVLLIVMLSGSRTAMVAVVLGSALTLLLRVGWLRRRPWILAAPVFIASLVPAFVPFPATAFTLRGNLWAIARESISQSPFFGQGASFWLRNSGRLNDGLASYSPHNIWLSLVVDLGVVGTVALVAVSVFGYLRSSPAGREFAMPFVFAMLSAGILEATALYQRLSPFPIGLLLALTALAFGYADRVQATEPPRPQLAVGPPADVPSAEELLRSRDVAVERFRARHRSPAG